MHTLKFLLLGFVACLLISCHMENVMDKTQFWNLVELTSNKASASKTSKSTELYEILINKKPDEIVDFYLDFRRHMNESNRADIWAAAKILNAGHCSDDCFEYFRCWLISNGQKVFESALNNPDNLAGLELQLSEGVPDAQDEAFCYVAADAYKKLTGNSIYKDPKLGTNIFKEGNPADFDWHQYSYEILEQRFPRLWNKYGKYSSSGSVDMGTNKTEMPKAQLEVSGLGLIEVGMTINHKAFGLGVIQDVLSGPQPAAVVKFSDGTRPIVLSAEHVALIGNSK